MIDIMTDTGTKQDKNLHLYENDPVWALMKVLRMTEHRLEMETKRADAAELAAVTDALTGVYSRRYIEEELERTHDESLRTRMTYSVIMIDIDHFKKVNDTYGHLAGDEVLRQTGALLKKEHRKMDSVGRWGGEELIVILPGANAEQAARIAEEMRWTIKATPVDVSRVSPQQKDPLRITSSLGVATFVPTASLPLEQETAMSVFSRADVAMYRAKQAGRDLVHSATATGSSEPVPYITEPPKRHRDNQAASTTAAVDTQIRLPFSPSP